MHCSLLVQIGLKSFERFFQGLIATKKDFPTNKIPMKLESFLHDRETLNSFLGFFSCVKVSQFAATFMYSNMLQSMDELIIQGTSSFPRKMDKHDLCNDNKPSFKQSAGRVRIT